MRRPMRLMAGVAATAMTAVVASAQGDRTEFFSRGGKREQCGALGAWLSDIGRQQPQVDFMQIQVQLLPRLMVVGFADSVFTARFGMPYGKLDRRQLGAVAKRIRECDLPAWAPAALLGAFDAAERGSIEYRLLLAASLPGLPIDPKVALEGIPPYFRPFELQTLGLRIALLQTATRLVARVVGVRAGSGAWLAGIVPGDVIDRIGQYQVFALDQVANTANAVRVGGGLMVGVRTDQGVAMATLTRQASDTGSWNTQGAELIKYDFGSRQQSGGKVAALNAKARMEEYDRSARELVLKGKCQVTADSMAALVRTSNQLAVSAGEATGGLEIPLRYASETACSDAKYGPLPDYEVLVTAMANQRVSACAALRGDDVTAEIAKQRETMAVTWYNQNNISTLERFYRTADTSERECMTRFLSDGVLGRVRR